MDDVEKVIQFVKKMKLPKEVEKLRKVTLKSLSEKNWGAIGIGMWHGFVTLEKEDPRRVFLSAVWDQFPKWVKKECERY